MILEEISLYLMNLFLIINIDIISISLSGNNKYLTANDFELLDYILLFIQAC
jgi:hypothetical protein